MTRVVVIGLDGFEPSLAFERFADGLPVLRELGRNGAQTRLRSCKPPITVPAWACMVTGADPGMLGLYGFHDRSAWDYASRRLASSVAFDHPTLWTLASRAGKRSRIIGVPPSYPARPLNGELITCFLTPDEASAFTYPPELSKSLGDYVFDTPEFRVEASAKAALKDDITRMITKRFAVARDWLARDDWDLFMMVEMGTDRAHHAFWRYLDPTHPQHVAGHSLSNAIKDVYEQVDAEIGRLCTLLRPSDKILIVSDHGACAMRGGFAINDWLAENGFLKLRSTTPQRFSADNVDWSRTSAWADGGYVGRIHLNVRGREPHGIVTDIEATLNAIAHTPSPIPLLIERSEHIYDAVKGYAPALQVEAGDLAYRCIASTGHPSLIVASNDTGPDDANHGRDGVLICNTPVDATSIYDVAPLVRDWLAL